MNNYLDKVFDTPNKKAFIAFLTAGDPDADSTVKFILEMDKAGADLIEIGIPFSDPTAEGVVAIPVISTDRVHRVPILQG